MEESTIQFYRLAKELSQLFDLEGNIDTVLSVSIVSHTVFSSQAKEATACITSG